MSQTIALIVITAITCVLFHLVDVLFWGTGWVKRKVYPFVPREIWRLPMDRDQQSAAGKRIMLLGALVTTFSAVVFVPLVWLIGPRFAGARAFLLAVLLWAVFALPGAFYNSIYYRIPRQMMWAQAWAGLARVLIGFSVITWLLTTFNAW